MTASRPTRSAYADQPAAADLRAAARTTGARLRWDRMTRPGTDEPSDAPQQAAPAAQAKSDAKPDVTPQVTSAAVRLADGLEQHLD